MSAAKHTPGPWIARRGTIGTAQFHIAEMMPSAYPDMPPGFAPAEQQEANAALIAAAPALLAALENLVEQCGAVRPFAGAIAPVGGDLVQHLDAARFLDAYAASQAAIRAAKGEA